MELRSDHVHVAKGLLEEMPREAGKRVYTVGLLGTAKEMGLLPKRAGDFWTVALPGLEREGIAPSLRLWP